MKAVTEIDVTLKTISNLTGIEYFTGLPELNCSSNRLKSIDLSKNRALTVVSLGADDGTKQELAMPAEIKVGENDLKQIIGVKDKAGYTVADVSAVDAEGASCGTYTEATGMLNCSQIPVKIRYTLNVSYGTAAAAMLVQLGLSQYSISYDLDGGALPADKTKPHRLQ